MKTIIKNFLKSVFFLAIMSGILILSILGSASVNSRAVPLGNMQLGAFQSGLSLYQLYKGSYYTFSPFNDYVVDNDGSKSNFISKEDASEKRYKTDMISLYPWTGIFYSLKNFVGAYFPAITFENGDKISYKAHVSGNNLNLVRTARIRGSSGVRILGTTLSFEVNDIVFDKSGNLMNIVDQNYINTFQRETGIVLNPKLDETEVALNGKVVFITSKNIPSTIVVIASKNQTLKVNWNARFIAVEEALTPINGEYINSVNIKVFGNAREAFYGN